MRAVSILVMLAVAGNAWANPKPRSFGYEEWEQAVIELQLDPRDVVYPFEATPEMMAWAEEKLQSYAQKDGILQLTVLQNALFNTSYSFVYDNMRTLTAADAFAAREGNCISFTSLFVAISRGLGYPTFLASVRRAPGIEKTDGVIVVNHHVVAAFRSPRRVHTFDFYTTSTEPHFHKRVIDDIAASAIFHTNLGGESIRNGDLDEARRHLEIATTLVPDWAPAWINLGVTRFRSGEVEGALEAYRSALLADPLNPSALTNMSMAYRSLGREEEAQTALRAAAEKGLEGTYHVTNQGSCSWLGFAETILEFAEKKGVEVEPISTEELGKPAPRPENSVLDCGKFEKATGMQLRRWPEALKDYLFG